jgi:transposase-like protein
MRYNDIMNFIEFNKQFPNDLDVINYYIKTRYKNKDSVTCSHCGSDRVSHRQDLPKKFQCNGCNNQFSIFKNTIFEKSCTDLVKWMYAIHLFLNSKKGISGYQLQREIGVTYKCAWRMLKKIREAMGNQQNKKMFEAIVEIDETYVGGKPRPSNNKDKDKDKDDKNKRGRGTKKTPVIGIVDRNEKKVHAKVAMPNAEGKKLSGNQLLAVIDEICSEGATIISDEFKGYDRLTKTNHVHLRIDHTKGYVDGDIHTNGIESFWATLKRGIYGIYHHVSSQHLQKYVDEFCFRYNNRNNGLMFDQLLGQTVLGG